MSLICVYFITDFNPHLIHFGYNNNLHNVILNYYCMDNKENSTTSEKEFKIKLNLMIIKTIMCFHDYLIKTKAHVSK